MFNDDRWCPCLLAFCCHHAETHGFHIANCRFFHPLCCRSTTAYFAPYDDTRSVTSDEASSAASLRKRLSPSIFSAPELGGGDASGGTSSIEDFPMRPMTPSAGSSIDGEDLLFCFACVSYAYPMFSNLDVFSSLA